MADERPNGKSKIIDITGILKRRREARENDASQERGGPNGRPEIPPPPMPGGTPESARQSLSQLRAAAQPLTELKKVPAVMRAFQAVPEWITPDGVTYFRTVLIVPIIILLQSALYWPALVIFVIAQILDFVDGALATARGCGTEDGAFLDPLADKIVVLFTFLALLDVLPWPWAPWMLFVSTMMAAALTFVRWQKRREAKPKSVAANPAGKLKLCCEAVSLSLCILGLALATPWLIVAGMMLFNLALALAFLSFNGQLRD